jgi:hypothetical protein
LGKNGRFKIINSHKKDTTKLNVMFFDL